MSFVKLREEETKRPLILLFAEGTILKPRSILTHYSIKAYIPAGNCVGLISHWHEQGAEIVYCTSLKEKRIKIMTELLTKYGFLGSGLYYRGAGQEYKDIVNEVKPDILIEDDCKSIGGARQMCITYADIHVKSKITSIVVPEFKGIDELPADIAVLENYRRQK